MTPKDRLTTPKLGVADRLAALRKAATPQPWRDAAPALEALVRAAEHQRDTRPGALPDLVAALAELDKVLDRK